MKRNAKALFILAAICLNFSFTFAEPKPKSCTEMVEALVQKAKGGDLFSQAVIHRVLSSNELNQIFSVAESFRALKSEISPSDLDQEGIRRINKERALDIAKEVEDILLASNQDPSATSPAEAPPSPAATAPEKPPISDEEARQIATQVTSRYSDPIPTSEQRTAADELRAFSSSASKTIVERDYAIQILLLALLSGENVLMLGTPGEAKTMLSHYFGRNIVEENGEPSFFEVQIVPETTRADLFGPLNSKKAIEEGINERNLSQGALSAKIVLFDEVGDARPGAARDTLRVMNEGDLPEFGKTHQGKIILGIGTTNFTIGGFYKKFEAVRPQATMDRYAFLISLPYGFESTDSVFGLANRNRRKDQAPQKLKFSSLEQLTSLADQVIIPDSLILVIHKIFEELKAMHEALDSKRMEAYEKARQRGEGGNPPPLSSRIYSSRSLAKTFDILRAAIVLDWALKNPNRSLIANVDDLQFLKPFFSLGGPSNEVINSALQRTTSKEQRDELNHILEERSIFEKTLEATLKELQTTTTAQKLAKLPQASDRIPSQMINDVLDDLQQERARAVSEGALPTQLSEVQIPALGIHVYRDRAIGILKSWLTKLHEKTPKGVEP